MNENRYICDLCQTPCNKVYGFNVDGQYKQFCNSCASKRK